MWFFDWSPLLGPGKLSSSMPLEFSYHGEEGSCARDLVGPGAPAPATLLAAMKSMADCPLFEARRANE